eukprot:scaffold10511_cov129-Isochrysis_galbana.AAC.10
MHAVAHSVKHRCTCGRMEKLRPAEQHRKQLVRVGCRAQVGAGQSAHAGRESVRKPACAVGSVARLRGQESFVQPPADVPSQSAPKERCSTADCVAQRCQRLRRSRVERRRVHRVGGPRRGQVRATTCGKDREQRRGGRAGKEDATSLAQVKGGGNEGGKGDVMGGRHARAEHTAPDEGRAAEGVGGGGGGGAARQGRAHGGGGSRSDSASPGAISAMRMSHSTTSSR